MRPSGVSFSEVATILIVASFLATFTAGSSLSVEENGIEGLGNFSVALNHSADERPEVAMNVTTEYPCQQRLCLPMCCPVGSHLLDDDACKSMNKSKTMKFPTQHDPLSLQSLPGQLRVEDFHVFAWNPCPGRDKFYVQPDTDEAKELKVLSNGSVAMTVDGSLLDHASFCFGAIADDDTYNIVQCFDEPEDYDQAASKGQVLPGLPIGMILSVPFLLLTFLIYSVIPELKNMHGCTLRAYVGSLIVAYTTLAYLQLTPSEKISDIPCKILAFIIHFSFLSSFFWLNVMCFDIWWTFGGFRSIQGTVKQREKKKFIMYSIYAWGSASMLTGICIIMDFVPGIPESFIRPQFGAESCWFVSESAKALYFYGPMGITVTCNICLFISTTMKIIQHKKDTAHHLKGMDSQRHDDNKQWFNLYLKLFIVMGINWSMEIISWFFKDSPQYVWYITDLMNTLQGVIIFIIFVWKNKTKRLLLKRLGCQNNSFQSRTSTRSGYLSSASRTMTTTAVMAPLQEKINPHTERNKTITDENDCV